MTTQEPIQPRTTMEEAWAESHRLWVESDRLLFESDRQRLESDYLRAKSRLVIILTAQALYGPGVLIDWVARTITPTKGA